MKAAVLHGKGDVRIEEVAEPPLGRNEVRVRLGAGGICGSDLSCFFKGGVGDFLVKEPLILGHEAAGEVVEAGADVTRVRPGDHVTVDPSRPCLACADCFAGRRHLCRQMRFFGSASVVPHVQGAFSESFTAREDMCHAVPQELPFETAACAEPLAVCLHAAARAGDLMGRHVVVAGAGPIGCLLIAVARRAGALSITVSQFFPRHELHHHRVARKAQRGKEILDYPGLEVKGGDRLDRRCGPVRRKTTKRPFGRGDDGAAIVGGDAGGAGPRAQRRLL